MRIMKLTEEVSRFLRPLTIAVLALGSLLASKPVSEATASTINQSVLQNNIVDTSSNSTIETEVTANAVASYTLSQVAANNT